MVSTLRSAASDLKKAMSSFIGDSTPRRVALYVVAAFLLYKVVKPRRKIPPGPLAIPLLGNLYMLEPPTDDAHKGEMPKTHRIFKDLADKYGPVFSFWFGFKLTIVISSPQLFHDAMKKQSVVFSGRFSPPSMHIITRNAGIALNEDQDAWRKFRSALLHALSSKQQGERTEPVILDEVRSTIHNFSQREEVGGFVELHDFRLQMRRESINVIMRCMFDFRYGVSLSSEFRDIDGIMEMTFARIAAGNPSDFIPILRFLPASKSLRELQDITDKRDKYIGSWLEHHRKTLDPTKPRDVLDELLVQQPKTGMTDEDIVVICWDAMAGGIDTSAATFEWAVYILIKNPRAQKKLHEELDRVVGPNRLPKYADAKNLPYSVATLMEVMRYRHFAPFGIPHATTDDAELGGYSIPKGTQVIVNMFALHHDQQLWTKPEEFRPERFLEEEKDLSKAFLDAEIKHKPEDFKFAPFGHGKRMCVGFGLGRIIAFLKFVNHMHCFEFSQASDKTPIDLDDEHVGITIMPSKYDIRVKLRPAAKLASSIEGKRAEH